MGIRDRDSADVWADRKLFLLEEDGSQQHVAGSPPDNFSEEGQKWGNPVYDYSYTVSYTHLDVYKRQHKRQEEDKNEENNFMFSGINHVHFTGCLRGNG